MTDKPYIVVCEKPFTPTSKEADELVSIANKQDKLLAVYQSTSTFPWWLLQPSSNSGAF